MTAPDLNALTPCTKRELARINLQAALFALIATDYRPAQRITLAPAPILSTTAAGA